MLPRPAIKKVFLLFAAALLALGLLVGKEPSHVRAAADQQQRGASLFHEKGCEHCHGVDGRGGDLGPDLSTIGKRWKDPQIEHQIHDGGGAMPAFGDALQPDEISALVDFLHAKRKAPKQRKAPPTP